MIVSTYFVSLIVILCAASVYTHPTSNFIIQPLTAHFEVAPPLLFPSPFFNKAVLPSLTTNPNTTDPAKAYFSCLPSFVHTVSFADR